MPSHHETPWFGAVNVRSSPKASAVTQGTLGRCPHTSISMLRTGFGLEWSGQNAWSKRLNDSVHPRSTRCEFSPVSGYAKPSVQSCLKVSG